MLCTNLQRELCARDRRSSHTSILVLWPVTVEILITVRSVPRSPSTREAEERVTGWTLNDDMDVLVSRLVRKVLEYFPGRLHDLDTFVFGISVSEDECLKGDIGMIINGNVNPPQIEMNGDNIAKNVRPFLLD